jgi:hypothetical protein
MGATAIFCTSTNVKKLDPEGNVDSTLSRPSLSFRQGTDVPCQLPLGLTQVFLSGRECFVFRGPDDPPLDNVHID